MIHLQQMKMWRLVEEVCIMKKKILTTTTMSLVPPNRRHKRQSLGEASFPLHKWTQRLRHWAKKLRVPSNDYVVGFLKQDNLVIGSSHNGIKEK